MKHIQLMLLAGSAFCAIVLAGCASTRSNKPEFNPMISKQPWGKTPDGQPVDLYTLRNSKGAEATITTYGGTVVSLTMPDRNGKLADIVLGYDHLDGYLTNSPFFGCIVGRYANRIGGAKFTLDGNTYQLAANNGPNNLHSGPKGLEKAVWTATPLGPASGAALELVYISPDGDQGFPGNLRVKATYTLTEDNSLRLEFIATTDKPTVCNLTHHSYFNLAGQGEILNHVVTIAAEKFTPIDATSIPLGELKPVAGTPFDFLKPTVVGTRINNDDEQLKNGAGYDHNWVFAKKPGELTHLASVSEPITGRVMDVWSTEPGLQFYTGNFLDGTITGKRGVVYQRRTGLCFEPGHYPDSPNKPQFPSTELRPGQAYFNTIIYRFSAK